jgi:hypothetical protein
VRNENQLGFFVREKNEKKIEKKQFNFFLKKRIFEKK